MVIKLFWEMVEGWTNEERKEFLRFAWARDRLPLNMGSNRMQIKVLSLPKALKQNKAKAEPPADAKPADNESKSDSVPLTMVVSEEESLRYPLPSSETCFFNVNLPRYPSMRIMQMKFKTAMACVNITS